MNRNEFLIYGGHAVANSTKQDFAWTVTYLTQFSYKVRKIEEVARSTFVTGGFRTPKGYIYFAMGFSLFVELLNLQLRKSKTAPVDLHQHYVPDNADAETQTK